MQRLPRMLAGARRPAGRRRRCSGGDVPERRRGRFPRTRSPATGRTSTTARPNLRLRDVPSSYGIVAVAFADATAHARRRHVQPRPDAVGAAGRVRRRRSSAATSPTLHAQGRKVVISVGGQNGAISLPGRGGRDRVRHQRPRADAELGLRRRRHRPGERAEPAEHDGGAAAAAAAGRPGAGAHDGAGDDLRAARRLVPAAHRPGARTSSRSSTRSTTTPAACWAATGGCTARGPWTSRPRSRTSCSTGTCGPTRSASACRRRRRRPAAGTSTRRW